MDSNREREEQRKPFVEIYETKMEDFIVDGKQRLIPMMIERRNFRYENLPVRERGAVNRVIGGLIIRRGLICSSCGNIMPKFDLIPGYFDNFPTSRKGYMRTKHHLFCVKCKAEMILENGHDIISGATAYIPPGGEPPDCGTCKSVRVSFSGSSGNNSLDSQDMEKRVSMDDDTSTAGSDNRIY